MVVDLRSSGGRRVGADFLVRQGRAMVEELRSSGGRGADFPADSGGLVRRPRVGWNGGGQELVRDCRAEAPGGPEEGVSSRNQYQDFEQSWFVRSFCLSPSRADMFGGTGLTQEADEQ